MSTYHNIYPKNIIFWSIFVAIMLVRTTVSTAIDYFSLEKVKGELSEIKLDIQYGGDIGLFLKDDNRLFYDEFSPQEIKLSVADLGEHDLFTFWSSDLKTFTPLLFTPKSKRQITSYHPIYTSKSVPKLWLYNFQDVPYVFILSVISMVGLLFNCIPLMLVNDWYFKIAVVLFTAFAGWCVNGLSWGLY